MAMLLCVVDIVIEWVKQLSNPLLTACFDLSTKAPHLLS